MTEHLREIEVREADARAVERRDIEYVVDDELQVLAPAVSVIVPAYNEAAHVAEQVSSVDRIMRRSGWTYEIIVVDDGSTDGTAQAANSAGLARVVRRAQNHGYGAALKLGVRLARYDWILITDADGTYPVESIPSLLAEAETNSMVVGSRTGEVVKVPVARRPAKWFLNRLASYLAGRHLPDINSGLRLMRKTLINRYEHLLPDGFSFTTTITLSAACNSHPLTYVPIDYHARLGESKIRPRHAYDFTLLIVRTIVFFNPLKVFLPLGALLAVFALGKLVYDIWKDNLSESAVLGILGALIVWAVGLLADQNARIATRRK